MERPIRFPIIEAREAIIESVKTNTYFVNYLAKDENNNPVIYNHSMEDRRYITSPALSVATDFEFDRVKENNQMAKVFPDMWLELSEEGEDVPGVREKVYMNAVRLISHLEKDRNLSGLVSNFVITGFKHIGQRKNAGGAFIQAYKMPISCTLI